MVIECKYEDLKNNMNNICEFVRENCEYSYFNLFSLHFCYLDQNLWLTLSIIVIIGSLCFFLLSDTSNRYLSNSLTILCDKLKISQNLAGLTFVAFGNGAPDVISSIIASKDDSDGVQFTLGALMGASIFVTSFVLSTVIIFAKSVKVEKCLFIRDILMYLFTLGILCAFSFNNKISLWESILFLSIYIIYAGIAVIQDKCSPQISDVKITDDVVSKEEIIADDIAYEIDNSEKKEDVCAKKDEEKNGIDEKESFRDELLAKFLARNQVIKSKQSRKGSVDIKFNESSYCGHDRTIDDLLRHDHFINKINPELLDEKNLSLTIPGRESELKQNGIINWHLINFRYRIKKHYFQHKETNWNQKNFINKIFYIIFEFPFSVLRDLTIPPVELSKWNRCFVIIMPVAVFIFIVYMTKNYAIFLSNIYVLISTIAALLIICFIISRYAYNNKLPNCIIILCILSFSMSVFWIWCISELLVDMLKVIGVLLDIPESFLGMTILAFGNSVPDLSVNCSLARNGYGEMAIAGSIAGPLFNVLVGLGISLVRKNILSGDIQFSFFDFDKDAIILIAFLAMFVNLFRLLIQGAISRFHLKLSVSYLGYFVYLAFCAGIFFFTFR